MKPIDDDDLPDDIHGRSMVIHLCWLGNRSGTQTSLSCESSNPGLKVWGSMDGVSAQSSTLLAFEVEAQPKIIRKFIEYKYWGFSWREFISDRAVRISRALYFRGPVRSRSTYVWYHKFFLLWTIRMVPYEIKSTSRAAFVILVYRYIW